MRVTGICTGSTCGDLPTPEPETPELTRPLRANEYGITGDTPMVNNADALAAFSNAPGQRVFAAEAGTVLAIDTVTTTDCLELGLETQADIYNCLVEELQGEEAGNISGLYRIPSINLQSDLQDLLLGFANFAQNPPIAPWGPGVDISVIPQSVLDYFAGRKRAQIVTVVGESGTWEYWVWAAERYISEGSTVQAGQCLGETIRMEVVNVSVEGSLGGPSLGSFFTNASQGVTFVEPPSGIPLSSIARGGDSVEPAGICSVIASGGAGVGEDIIGISGRFSACMSEIDLSYRAAWQSSGATWDAGDRVRIDAGGFIQSTLNLDMAREPVLMISWRWQGSDDTPGGRVSLGDEVITFRRAGFEGATAADVWDTVSLIQSSFQLDEWELPDKPNNAGFYDLRISPVPGRSIEVEYICVYNRLDSEGQPSAIAPSHCYFDNFTFAGGLTSWNASVSPVPIDTGQSPILPSFGWVGQDVALTDNNGIPVAYTLSVKFGIHDTSSDWIYNLPDLEIEVWYEYGAITDNQFELWNIIGQQELIDRQNFISMGNVIFIDANESQLSELKVQFRINDGGAGTAGVRLFEVCLNPEDGVWPNSENIPTFRTDCSFVPVPAGDNLGQWTVYHWRQLNRFFQCDLMVFLNEMDNRIREFFSTATMFFRWVIVSFNIVMTWVSTDLLFWLNGHLHNITNGNVTFIEGGAQTCNSIWCALGALFGGGASIFDSIATVIVSAIEEIFAPIIQLVSFLITGAFTFFTSVAQQVLDLLFYAVRLLLEVVVNLFGLLERIIYDMTTAEPIPIPHAPYCATDPGGNAWCRLSWVAENTIFTGPGEAIIPLITGYIAVMLILWVISEIKRSIIESGSLL